MEGRTLAIGTYRTRLDEQFEIVAPTEDERESIRAGMRRVEERIEADMDPFGAAARRDIDEIVKPSELRGYLEAVVGMAYQSTGYRRIKNPRIWSLHDLQVLAR